jgi:TRAP-type C4-dicarboxylate transport system substrate-binding protein
VRRGTGVRAAGVSLTVRAAAFGAALAFVLAGCSITGTKAGAGQPPTVLHLATVKSRGGPNAKDAAIFADRVFALTHGTVQVEVDYDVVPLRPDAEQRVMAMARDGTTELALAPARVFDTVGFDGFEALQTPMLIDTPELAGAVATSDVAAGMLAGLAEDGLSGLGLAYEGLRRPVALNGAVTRAADFEGLKIQTQASNLSDRTLEALGARPEHSVGRLDNAGREYPIVDTEFLLAIHDFPQGTATANVVLFPKYDVILANPTALSRLTDAQQRAIRRAARETAATAASTTTDEQFLAERFCEGGGRLVSVPAGELDRIRSRLEPVVDQLRQDPETASAIQSIETIKTQISGPQFRTPQVCLPPTGDGARLPSTPAAPTP